MNLLLPIYISPIFRLPSPGGARGGGREHGEAEGATAEAQVRAENDLQRGPREARQEPAKDEGGAARAQVQVRRRPVQEVAGSGGDKYPLQEKYPILPFTGEISYLCFSGSQKYF